MREIKFRGELLYRNDDDPALVYGQFIWDAWHHPRIQNEHGAFEVKPKTVGQFTGLKANGKEIYEGDILLDHDHGQVERYWGVVVYQVAEFIVRYHGLRNKTWQELTCLADGNCDEWTIIGNIYENPELLK
jgi:uncharacterized phage protein (TIGR01671 family)